MSQISPNFKTRTLDSSFLSLSGAMKVNKTHPPPPRCWAPKVQKLLTVSSRVVLSQSKSLCPHLSHNIRTPDIVALSQPKGGVTHLFHDKKLSLSRFLLFDGYDSFYLHGGRW